MHRQRAKPVDDQSEAGLEDLVSGAGGLRPALRADAFGDRRPDGITIDHVKDEGAQDGIDSGGTQTLFYDVKIDFGAGFGLGQ